MEDFNAASIDTYHNVHSWNRVFGFRIIFIIYHYSKLVVHLYRQVPQLEDGKVVSTILFQFAGIVFQLCGFPFIHLVAEENLLNAHSITIDICCN